MSLLQGRNNYKEVGDDKQMVQARVRVHKLPAFAGLANAIRGYCPPIASGCAILDIGCGDGFFLDQVTNAAKVPCLGVGVDVSKGALAKAAKSHPSLLFIRTDAAHSRLPFGDSAFGMVMSVFAPRPVGEIRRVLRDDGSWLIVTATQDHLKEIRQFLPLAAIGTGKLDTPTSEFFSIQSSGVSVSELEVARPDLVSLVEMSPSVYRLRREFGDKWTDRLPERLSVTFSFSITLLAKGVR